MNQNPYFYMDQTPTLKTLTKDFIHEFCYDDTGDDHILELYHKRHGHSYRSMPRKSIFRDREIGHRRLVNNYFSSNLVYLEQICQRKYYMGRHVFLRIVDALLNVDL